MKKTCALSEFTWRPTQRRLKSSDKKLRAFSEIEITGQQFIILFRFHNECYDPYTVKKMARLYLPDSKTTPAEFQDIKLYVHI
jgi:hypothetical protein